MKIYALIGQVEFSHEELLGLYTSEENLLKSVELISNSEYVEKTDEKFPVDRYDYDYLLSVEWETDRIPHIEMKRKVVK